MSATMASGASKPNGAGLPMLSLRILWPSASSRWASTRIGPRTSLRTCCSFWLWTIGRMPQSPREASHAACEYRPVRDISYPPIIVTAKMLFRVLGLRFQMHGTEHVPREGGALLAFNHVSYIDFVLGGLAAQPSKRLVGFLAKREVFDHAVAGPVMRSMHHISVDRADGGASLEEA